jgi:hypothetical protein
VSAGWYFTAPWYPVSVRRGDALGFRPGTDYFSDLVAPGLSNATYDARWISLLSWCLQWSHIVWQNAGGVDLSRRDDQRARYAWLRPLELLWIARTLKARQDTGQLRGRRSIERWFKANELPPNFAMNDEQFRRYRQVGMYGAYRVVFRTISGLTTGDGWTPADTALKLADLVNDKLPSAARLSQAHFENGTKWGHWSDDNEARYWLTHGWRGWPTVGGFLPSPDSAASERLPEEERSLLEPSLFGVDSVRRATAEVLARAKGARSHPALCDLLANSSVLSKKTESVSLALLPAFSRLADTAMHAMRGLWSEINHDDTEQAPTVEKLARSAILRSRFDQIRGASTVWLNAPARNLFPHDQVVTQLADAMTKAKTPSDQIRALTKHHHDHGGGRHWFREQAGKLVPLVADTGIAASNYRFRLRSLCLLAAQCGVANMDSALMAMAQEVGDEEEKDYE